jgi:hypothetical protein
MKIISFIMAFILLLAFYTAWAQPAHTKLLLSDPLDNSASQTFASFSNNGGSLLAGQGWQATNSSSQLFITLRTLCRVRLHLLWMSKILILFHKTLQPSSKLSTCIPSQTATQIFLVQRAPGRTSEQAQIAPAGLVQQDFDFWQPPRVLAPVYTRIACFHLPGI